MALLVAAVALAVGLVFAVGSPRPSQQAASKHARLLPVMRHRKSPTMTTNPPVQSSSPPTTLPLPPTLGRDYAPPPYISQATADAIALWVARNMGGHGRVVRATLTNVAGASKEVDTRVADLQVPAARMVWLVWVVGTYLTEAGCTFSSSSCLQPTTLFYVTEDASTGRPYSDGSTPDMPGAPAVPKGVHLGPFRP